MVTAVQTNSIRLLLRIRAHQGRRTIALNLNAPLSQRNRKKSDANKPWQKPRPSMAVRRLAWTSSHRHFHAPFLRRRA